jgi:hypothetical protein
MPSIDGNLSHEIIVGTKNGKVLCLSGGQLAIPVELTSFSGYAADGNIYLQWSTATEKNNYGFEIERVAETSNSKENRLWRSIGFINGSGTTSQLKSYSFADRNIASGKYIYRLKQIDYDGSLSGIVRPLGYEVTPVSVRKCLHFKTACTAFPDGRLLVNPEWLDTDALSEFECISVPEAEPLAANMLLVRNTVCIASAHKKTAALIRSFGFEVRIADISELSKAEGAMTCSSLLLDGV